MVPTPFYVSTSDIEGTASIRAIAKLTDFEGKTIESE